MASKVQVVLVDDIDGGEADRTVAFSIEGTEYEIDLSEANAEAFLETLAPYVASARRLGRGGKSRRRSAAKSDGAGAPSSAQVRAWAAEEGIEVSARGRVPADVIAKYEAAHN